MDAIANCIIKDDQTFRKHYIEILKRHIGIFITIDQSSTQEDMNEGFDYVLIFDKAKIAVRNRDYSYLKSFGDFTIRSKTRWGDKTEIHKIREGYGDIYLYVWQDTEGNSLDTYLLVDLDKLRDSGLLDEERKVIWNRDGTGFFAYTIDELEEAGCIIAYRKYK